MRTKKIKNLIYVTFTLSVTDGCNVQRFHVRTTHGHDIIATITVSQVPEAEPIRKLRRQEARKFCRQHLTRAQGCRSGGRLPGIATCHRVVIAPCTACLRPSTKGLLGGGMSGCTIEPVELYAGTARPGTAVGCRSVTRP